MANRWFRLDDYYESVGDGYVFYPHPYARGYRFSLKQRATMDSVLGPFLAGRLKIEFVIVFCFATFAFVLAVTGFLFTASNEELSALLATPRWVWLVVATAFAALMLIPILVRLQSKIRHQLNGMGVVANEPPRPDFLIVDSEFSTTRLSYFLLGTGAILAIILTNI